MAYDYLHIWHRALESELGIAIKTNDKALTRGHLYTARKLAADPSLASLILRDIPGDELLIVKKTVELD